MAETMVCHGLEERFYRKLEEMAMKAGMTPEQYAVQLVRESLLEKTRPKGAGKLRHLPRP
jgi:hypothetical protein